MATDAPRGLGWILFANMAIAIDYSMIMSTGWEFVDSLGGSKLFYGATIAAFPVGRILLMMPIGSWSDRSGFFFPFCTANATGVLGGLVYGLAPALGSKWFLILGRFLGGCGATLPMSAWAARSYPPQKRVQIESLQKALQLVGVTLGPAMNAIFFKLDVKVGFLTLNPLTCAGFFPAFMSFSMLVGFMLYVSEPPARVSPLEPTTAAEPFRRLTTTGAWVLIFNAFQSNFQISAIDVILAPLAAQHLGWNLLQNSGLFAGLAGISFIGAVTSMIATKRGMKAMSLVKYGLIINLVSSTMLGFALANAPDNLHMLSLIVGTILGCWSMLVYSGPNGGLFQQACGDLQGVLGAYYSMAYACGRPVGAMVGSALLNHTPLPMCLSAPLVVILNFVWLHMVQRRLQHAEDQAFSEHLQCQRLHDTISNPGNET
eukprot:TRINITY_DN68144_c0_g1_i1.p1 TRINITY_DN68144_c0_g1~~TRINITY_DN68144_c0_g1_i1.p1  ORF type:complete len:430 (+),score=50.91 TRINITY_DN68144_c0_g1_i1:65-1354(+)